MQSYQNLQGWRFLANRIGSIISVVRVVSCGLTIGVLSALLLVACGQPEATPRPAPSLPVTEERSTSYPVDLDAASAQTEDFAPPGPEIDAKDLREALVKGHRFILEVARTPMERARGLMDRPSLAEDAAMLFVFEQETYLTFWMKETLIPLDILFLDAQGLVVDVQTMQTQPAASEAELKRYRSAWPARYAIELNAGLARALEVVPGVQVLFR